MLMTPWQRDGRNAIKELLEGGADIAKLTQAKRNQERLDKITNDRAEAKAKKVNKPRPKQRSGSSIEKEQGDVDAKDLKLDDGAKADDDADSDVDLS
jgi:hypothetical protein